MSGYLLDSNAYFRLAKSFHPLLGGPFSPQQIVLNVLAEVDREHSHSPRLDSKFAWVTQEEYVRNRRANLLTVRGVEADNVKHAAWFIRDWVRASRQLFRERNATQRHPRRRIVQYLLTRMPSASPWLPMTKEWKLPQRSSRSN